MPELIGVRFKSCGKIYDFEVDGIEVNVGDPVVVESELGLNIGNVVKSLYTIEESARKFKKAIRKATEEDLCQKEENKNLEREAMENCLERIMARGLLMKLIRTEVTLDRRRIIFYFTAEKRIDFRELVKDLAAKFKTRIEMRQIGVRDEAKIIGSFGICGKEVCCSKFLTTFEPISIRMAKKQELVLNTGKLSGVCGRLMCCLGFEYSEGSQEESLFNDSDSISISEVPEVTETVVASSDSVEGIEDQTQTLRMRSDSPDQGHKKTDNERRNYFKRHKRKRRRKPHKK
jgi:cell fate regulator YaaT (PSP1 superfamily)